MYCIIVNLDKKEYYYYGKHKEVFRGDNFYNEMILYMLSEKNGWHKNRIECASSDDKTDYEGSNLYNYALKNFKCVRDCQPWLSDVNYLINHMTEEYFKIEKSKVHPLPLLAFGDWKGNILSTSNKVDDKLKQKTLEN